MHFSPLVLNAHSASWSGPRTRTPAPPCAALGWAPPGRCHSPLGPAKVQFTAYGVRRAAAGTKHNIIPAEARLSLNLRTQDTQVRDRVLEAVRRIVAGECRTAGCPAPPEVAASCCGRRTARGRNRPGPPEFPTGGPQPVLGVRDSP
ncbi:peptidase dimerization domain-containing protein [Streptomyces pratensis]|uniref:peptidase dimerization domain-containing protein n=1 Tax=Streptomyces pratensis TaxID=1169025 RepID=UPI0030169BB5